MKRVRNKMGGEAIRSGLKSVKKDPNKKHMDAVAIMSDSNADTFIRTFSIRISIIL